MKSDIGPQRTALTRAANNRRLTMTNAVICFVLGTIAPLGLTGWLVLQH